MTAQGQVDPDGLGNAKMRGSRVGQGLDGHRLQVRAPGMLQDQRAVSPSYTVASAPSCPLPAGIRPAWTRPRGVEVPCRCTSAFSLRGYAKDEPKATPEGLVTVERKPEHPSSIDS